MQTALKTTRHWTEGNTPGLVRWIASDLMAQLEMRMEQIPGCNHVELSKRLRVTVGRVSQVMNTPGNITLRNAVHYSGAVDRKVVFVTYDAAVVPSGCAPISGDVFRACWEKLGRPLNMFDFRDNTSSWSSPAYPANSNGVLYLNGGAVNGQGWRPVDGTFDTGSSVSKVTH